MLLILLAALAHRAAGQCHVAANPHYACPAACFCAPTYNQSELLDEDGIQFSSRYNLSLRLFSPPASDTRPSRPAMLVIHGGGFKGHTRDDVPGIIFWSQQLAMRGYVAASIDYRLDGQTDIEKANTDAMYDARAAVRWLRRHAASLRVDGSRIGAFGSSAGAMTVLFMTTVDGEGQSGNPGFSSAISVGVGLSGALLPNPGVANITASQPPYLDFHGCDDTTVPYSVHKVPSDPLNVSAVGTIAALRRRGNPDAALYSFAGAGHVPWDQLAQTQPTSALVAFLATHLDLKSTACPRR